MHKLYSPDSEFDLMFIKSLLDSDNINYYVHNDHFGSLNVGPCIGLFNAKTIFVSDLDKERSENLLNSYLDNQKIETIENEEALSNSLARKFRMLLEAIVFMWFIPDIKRYRIKRKEKN